MDFPSESHADINLNLTFEVALDGVEGLTNKSPVILLDDAVKKVECILMDTELSVASSSGPAT